MSEKEIYKLYSQILSGVSFKRFIEIINEVYNNGYGRGYNKGASDMLGSGRDFNIKNK